MQICDDRKITQKENYDVIVVGGGIAGVSAAVSAARSNASVLLIEKQVNLGGLATGGLISWYEPLCDGQGTQMVYGIAEELIRLCGKYSFENLPEKWGGGGHNERRNGRFSTFFSPTVFTLALDEFVIQSGVKIRFDTMAVYPVTENNRCMGVICESASGKEFFGCKIVIDATGDASVCERAGMPTVIGENYMTYVAHMYNTSNIDNFNNDKDICKMRKWVTVGSDMRGNGHPEGLRMLKGDSADDITDYIIYGKRNMLEKCKAFDKNSYDIMTLPTMPQFRTIRRIIGDTDFTAENGKKYCDSIGTCGDFRPEGIGNHYEIPYSSMYNSKFSNILVCGRIISAPQGDGWEVARVIPTCALTGEAAGKAAAAAAKNNCAVNDDKIINLFSK